MFHNCLFSFIHKTIEGHVTHTNQIGRFHNAENSYYYYKGRKICLKCNKLHLFLPEALGGRGKSTITKSVQEEKAAVFIRDVVEGIHSHKGVGLNDL